MCRAIPSKLKEAVFEKLSKDENYLFGVVGDLTLQGKYEDTLLVYTEV